MTGPQNPIGEYVLESDWGPDRRRALIDVVAKAPVELRRTVSGLSESMLDTTYRNWTVRQIVHHLADSHANCYIRFRLALTEETPTIKPYFEGLWAELPDARSAPLEPSLQIFDGIHDRWTRLLHSMTDNQFSRTYFHPQSNETMSLAQALSLYAWHCRHHTGQIRWLADQHGWKKNDNLV